MRGLIFGAIIVALVGCSMFGVPPELQEEIATKDAEINTLKAQLQKAVSPEEAGALRSRLDAARKEMSELTSRAKEFRSEAIRTVSASGVKTAFDWANLLLPGIGGLGTIAAGIIGGIGRSKKNATA